MSDATPHKQNDVAVFEVIPAAMSKLRSLGFVLGAEGPSCVGAAGCSRKVTRLDRKRHL